MERLLHRALVSALSIAPLILFVLSVQNIPLLSSAAPQTVNGARYATANNTLFVQGGYYVIPTMPATPFSALDLSIPWNVTSPPWRTIELGDSVQLTNIHQGMATTPDQTRLVFWGSFTGPLNNSVVIYNIPNNTWSTLTFTAAYVNSVVSPIPIPLLGTGISAVIDPASAGKGLGDLYAPDGCSEEALSLMCRATLGTKTYGIAPMPGGLVPSGIQYFSFAYCTIRKSMLLYGGMSPMNVSNPNLYEFIPSTSAWSLLQPQGTSPGDVSGHCMVETTDRSKMLVFGGMNTAMQTSSRLFILNLDTMIWTEGADVGAASARAYHVCGTNGDSLVVWGGAIVINNQQVVVNNIPLVYNIPNNTWVQTFVVSNAPPPTTSASTSVSAGPTSTPSGNIAQPFPEKKSSDVGAVAGGTVGCIAAIAAIGFFFYKWHKRTGKSGDRPSQTKRSGKDSSSRFGMKGGFIGRTSNRDDDDEDDTDPYSDYPEPRAIQLQNTSGQHTSDPYLSSSPHFSKQSQSSSVAMSPPLLQLLPSRPETQTRNTLLSYGSNPADPRLSTMDHSGVSSRNIDSLRFSGINSSLPAAFPFLPLQSTSPFPLNGSPQGQQGSLSFIPVDSHGHSIYYDANRNAFSAGSQQGSFPTASLSQPNCYDGRNSNLSGSVNSPDSHLTCTPYSNSPQYSLIGSDRPGIHGDYRSPQQPGPGVETSPAAWMAAMNTRNSVGNPHSMINQGSYHSGKIGGHGSYYPPPPGQQSEPDLTEKKRKLIKAQHELDVEKMRLEQESQQQLIGWQLFER
ncbi:hypothetical protein EMPS_04830 [Entomortierella parvispora]|uniref:Uncharacterized protein n=1 Tax=Entomortierella parvispora TaxID=205924 RepID=A0A9P3LVW4_9FUNG|nr:hypothetical protein EMPS_04830 [Entomortierella parvispora]